jgi:hypothetical protein
MPTKTATDTSKQCSITNNSGKDVSLLTIVPTGETGSSNAISVAGGGLEVLKTTEGNTAIKNGSSAGVTLDHSSNEGGQIRNYDLIVGDSAWLYPVGLLAVSQQTDGGATGYPSQTITQNGGTAMAQAELFYQTIAAYPSSQLCQDYVAALQAAKDAAEARADGSPGSASAVASAIDDALQSFFRGTTSYNQVTLAHLAAVDAYHKKLPFAWAQYKNGFTYYLYGTDGTSSLFAGTLSLQKTRVVDVTRPNGGYTCQFVPAVNPADLSKTDVDDSKGIALTYAEGLFVDDPKATNPKIALRGDYILNRAFTVNGDDNAIVTIVSGGVNGVSCIGLDAQQKSSALVQPNVVAASSVSDEAVKYWDQLTHPENMTQWVVSIMTLIGAVALIPALSFAVYRICRVVQYKMARKEALEKNKIEEVITSVNDEVAIIRIKWATSGKAVIPEYGLEKLKGAVDLELASGLNQALAGSLATQKYAAKELLEYSTMLDDTSLGKLQSLVSSIRKSEMTVSQCIDEIFIQNPDAETLLPGKLKILEDEFQRFSKNQTDFEAIYKKVNQALSDEARAEIDGAMSSASMLFDNLEKAQLEDEASKDDLDPKPEDHIVPELV